MKNFLFIISLVISTSSLATIYETIDVNGVINWSTDGGITDCGCDPGNSSKHDSIYVLHPYTFSVGFFGSDGAIEAPMVVSVPVGQVVFEDRIEIRKIPIEVIGSDVRFMGDFEITGAGQNIGTVSLLAGSSVIFEGNFQGNKQGTGYVICNNSSVQFVDFTVVNQLRVLTLIGSSVSFGNGSRLVSSWIVNGKNTAVAYGDNMLIEDSEFEIFTNNVTMGNNIRVTNGSIVSVFQNTHFTLPGTTEFIESSLNMYAGSVCTFSDGIVIRDCEINIGDLGIANFVNANIDENNGKSTISISGLLNCDSTTNILNTDLSVTSTGIVDLVEAIDCDFSGSKVNKKNASSILNCGAVYNPDNNEFNIWENQSWSQGSAPNNVGVYAEIRDDYFTNIGGDIVAGNLFIEQNKYVEISSGGFIHITQEYTSFGSLKITNNGSLVFNPSTKYNMNTGVSEVEREGLQSAMKYNIWSNPVKDTMGILLNYPETNPCDVYVFDAGIQNWKYDYQPYAEATCAGNPVVFQPHDIISGGDGLMDAGRGYFMPGNDLNAVRSFKGILNNGEIIQNIYTTGNGSTSDWEGDDWNMVGNPYPSGLDLYNFWTTNGVQNNTITDGVYFWLEDVNPPYDQFASYGVWNLTGETYYYDTAGFSSSVSDIVAAGLGFWVYANDFQNQGVDVHELVFDNSMRTTSQSGVSINRLTDERDRHQAWINITNGSNMFDQILIGTHPDASDGVDPDFDAHLNFNWEPLIIATVNDSQLFTIQGFEERKAVDTLLIPLLIKSADNTTHSLTLDSSNFFLNHKRIFLLDNLLNTEIEMLLGQNIDLPIDSAGLYRNRFQLKITNSYITSLENSTNNNLDGRIWVAQNMLMFSRFNAVIETIKVYDARGVEVIFKKPNTKHGNISLSNLSSGLFVVELTDERGNKIIQKIIISD